MLQIQHKAKRGILVTAGFLLYWISCFFPRNKRIWVFGSRWGFGYSDNSKHLFEYVHTHVRKIQCVWITNDRSLRSVMTHAGLRVFHSQSVAGIWYCLRAKVVVSSYHPFMDVQGYAIGGSTIIQLFHGTPLKKINRDDIYASRNRKNDFIGKLKTALFPFKNPNKADLVIAASDNVVNNLMTAFALERDKIKVTGLPRNDVLLRNEPASHEFIEDLRKPFATAKIIAYLPTFQHGDNGAPEIVLDDFAGAQKTINDNLRLFDSVLLLRLHPVLWDKAQEGTLTHYQDKNTNLDFVGDSQSRIINSGGRYLEDFYPILKDVDILITDYSSIYFDFLLLNRPIIFFPTKRDGNLVNRRGLYHHYDEVTPGPKAQSWDDIFYYVGLFIKDPTFYEKERLKIQKQFNTYVDSHSCERVYHEIASLVKA